MTTKNKNIKAGTLINIQVPESIISCVSPPAAESNCSNEDQDGGEAERHGEESQRQLVAEP